MSLNEINEEKKFSTKHWDGRQRIAQYKAFKSKLEGLEDAAFERGAVKHAAKFSMTFEDIADPNQVQQWYGTNGQKSWAANSYLSSKTNRSNCNIRGWNNYKIEGWYDEHKHLEEGIWKKYNKEAEFKEKEKRVFPIIL